MTKDNDTKLKINDLVEVIGWDDNIRRDWIVVDLASNGGTAIIMNIFSREQTTILVSKLKHQNKDEDK